MANASNQPIQTFREGAVGASVWRRTGKNGDFFEFTLSRAYAKNHDETGYSQCFGASNEAALLKVIAEASAFIRSIECGEASNAT